MDEEKMSQYNEEQSAQSKQNGTIRPDNYMIWSIFTTIFCCIPFGIAAIVYSAMVNTHWNSGNYEAAIRSSRLARNWSLISAAVGLISILLYVVFVFILGYNWSLWNGFMY